MMGTMEELVEQLNKASDAYYNLGRPIMTDFEFDELINKLLYLEEKEKRVLPNSPTQTVGAPAVDTLEKFEHPYPALSLDKTKDKKLIEQKFRNGLGASDPPDSRLVVMYKEDGATIQAYYNNGTLNKLVTRGDGHIGSVITHNAKCIKGLPVRIAYKGHLIVRGEALMSYKEFERINEKLPDEEKYRNPRNLAAATLTMLDSNEAAERQLVLKAFNLVHIDMDNETDANASREAIALQNSFNERLNYLNALGFSTVDRELTPLNGLSEVMDKFSDNVKVYPYPVDGLVIAMNSYSTTKLL